MLTSGAIAQESNNVAVSEENQNNVDSTEVKKKSPQTAMICALIFPGLGQLYNGKKLKALILGGAEIGLLINSIYLNQMYKQSTSEAEREFYIQNRNLSTWYLVGVVLYNILDAFVDAHMYNFDESKDLSLQIDPSDVNPKIMLSLSVNF
ncbi:hypothetical protein GF337_13595 [candidate division KSB1 bacterium]|nr:hypothetical protein [candidate division KSB1 bacterium]